MNYAKENFCACMHAGCFDEKTYTVNFSKETLIAGPNNSGKSMLFAGMNLIRNFAVNRSPIWSSEFYNLTSRKAVVHNHEVDREIEISMTLTDNSQEYIYNLRIDSKERWNLTVNGERFDASRKNLIRTIQHMAKIWFFSPNRSPVRYMVSVEPTAGPLQPLRPDGSNVINYLLERWTDQDPRWDTAQSWLKKVDADMSIVKTPIRGRQVFLETMMGNVPINVSLQGSGFQSATAIVPAVVFLPKDSTMIIEEPEVFLHPSSQETVVDMINDAVNNHNKQLIFSTHSYNILLLFYKDVGLDGRGRIAEHMRADPDKFRMWTFKKAASKISIKRYPIQNKTWQHFRDDFKYLWG